MTASALPIELYHTIFQHVTNKNDLCSLARCSSTFQSLAEPFIYHFISSKYQIKFIKAAQSTISRPHRHRLVKTLHLRSFWSPEAFNHSALPRLMAKLLRVTSQLRALRIDGFVRSMWILKSCSHPLLTTLGIVTPASHMDSQVEVNNQRYDRQYLERHANITKLVLRVVGNLPVIGWDASHHLPNLDTLYYIGPRTSFLLKDRDLQRVRLRFNSVNYDTEELVSHLSSMRATLQVLDLSEFHGLRQSWSLQSMQGFLRNLPSLRLFGLPLSKSHNNEEDLVQILQSCSPTLEILRLADNLGPDERPPDPSKLFSTRESLKWIIIVSTWSRVNIDRVFTKDSPESFLSDKSDLRSRLWDLGVRTEPWENGLLRELVD